METNNSEKSIKQRQTAPNIVGNFVPMSEQISNVVFYIPFLYIYVVRLGTISKIISIYIIYVIPTFYFLSLHIGVGREQLVLYLLSFWLIYGLYELGYIQNDTETIKKENFPAIRLYQHNFDHYEHYKLVIYLTRILWCILLSVSILFINGFAMYTYLFLISAWCIALVYQAYNKVRSRWNLLCLFLLICLRYFSYIFIFLDFIKISHVLALFFSYPILKFIEMGAKKRYNIIFLQKIYPNKETIPIIRVKYGFISSLLSIFLLWIGFFNIFDMFFFLYFFLYRFSIYLISTRLHIYFRNYIND